ncbi:MAG: hypothetical protein E7634_05915 [Ruminococcaceae bacterium]|nr:hypothetical protein [Oscillospiraceae bacterium]
MKKALSLLLCSIILFISSLGLSGCNLNKKNPFPYRGEYKELYTTAIYSIPDAEGYMHHGEGAYNSDIYVWEQDDYGRTLFSYCEDYGNQIFGLIISQAYDESNVYFYPDINYALTLIDSEYSYEGIKDDNFLKNKTKDFYLENKDKLKEANDWNKPIDKNKCVSYPITDHKVLNKNTYSLSSLECNEILNEYTKTLDLPNPENTPHRYNSILQVDAEGKILHEIYGVHRHYDNPDWKKTDEFTYYSITLWVITDKDGNYDKEKGVMVMYSKGNESDESFIYNAEEVLEFKKQNNWKNSYCGN